MQCSSGFHGRLLGIRHPLYHKALTPDDYLNASHFAREQAVYLPKPGCANMSRKAEVPGCLTRLSVRICHTVPATIHRKNTIISRVVSQLRNNLRRAVLARS
jgi:hypothetical protein